MSRHIRLAIIALVAVVVLAGVGAGLWLRYSLDGYIARTMEDVGSRMAGTRVRVSSVHVSLRTGKGTVRLVEVANPKGYSSGDALSFGRISLQMKLASLRSDPLVLDELVVDDPHVSYQLASSGKANLDAIRDALQRFSPPSSKGSVSQRRLLIRNVRISGGRIDVDATPFGGQKQAVDIAPIRMTNVGGPNGSSPEAVGQQIMMAVQRSVTQQVARQAIQHEVEKQLGGAVKDKLKGLFR